MFLVYLVSLNVKVNRRSNCITKTKAFLERNLQPLGRIKSLFGVKNNRFYPKSDIFLWELSIFGHSKQDRMKSFIVKVNRTPPRLLWRSHSAKIVKLA